jgi:glycosyltransferase involved in cell wall biosynthesis
VNIAVVHPYPVHAAAVGGVTRVYELVSFLARRHRVSVFTHRTSDAPAQDSSLTALGVEQRAFAPEPATLRGKARSCIGPAPYYVYRNANPSLTTALGEADAREPFDVVHLELGYMVPALSGVGPHAVRTLAEQEAMPFVIDRLRHVSWRRRTLYEKVAVLTSGRIRRFDRQTLSTFDLVYGITPRERDYLQEASGRSAAVLPHVVSAARFASVREDAAVPASVLFVGNFGHHPNRHAALWFVERVWPLVRASLPLTQFEIVGAGMDDEWRSRLEGPGVTVRGYEPDLRAAYQRSVVVVNPVHSGGGMRGKVLEAFASGRALVSTPLGLEGIAAVSGSHCLVGESPADFAAAVLTYLRDRGMRRAHGATARALVCEHYDAPVVFARLECDFEAAVDARRAGARKATA